MPGGEESLRKGTYGALSTETPPEANGAQAEARVSYIQAHHCLWSESQHNEVPPPHTVHVSGTTHVPGIRCSRAWDKLLSYSASFSRGPMMGERQRERRGSL